MANQPLVLVLDAQTGKLKTALKDAGTSLADYSKTAQQIMDEVQTAMQDDLAQGADKMAARMSKSLQQQITLMRRQAQSALAQGQDYSPLGGMNSVSSIAAAEAQERLARSYREQAAAAAAATGADEQEALALRQVAVASELAAGEADKQATLLRKQASVFSAIEAEMGITAEQAATKVTGSHNRMSVSSMLLMHSVRSAGDSFAAGLPITTIFAEQIGRLGEAAELSQGSFGRFGALMSGPWGIAILAGVTVLGLLVKELSESAGKANEAASAHETMAQKLNLQLHALDAVVEATREYNHEQEKSRILTLENAQAVAKEAAANINAALAIRQKLKADLESVAAHANDEGAGNGTVFGSAGVVSTVRNAEIKSQIAENDAKLKDLITGGRNAVIGVADELAKIATDPKYAIEQRFAKLKNEARASIRDVGQLAARLADLTRQQQAAEDALKPVRSRAARTRRGPADRTPGNDSAYDAEFDRLTGQIDQARTKGVTDPGELARLEKEHLDDVRQRARDDILAKARRASWSKADTDALLAKEDELVATEKAAIDAKLKAELAKKDQETQIKALEMADTLLQLQQQLAPTLSERVRIQNQILANERQIALLRANGDPAATAQVNKQYDLQQQIQNKSNADPLTRYIDQIKQHSGDMNTALKSVEADGLNNLSNGLIGIISGTESVGSAFKHMADQIIADLARIAIEKAIVGLLGNIGGGGGGGGFGAGFSAVSAGGVGFADGGMVFGPGGPREDRVPAMLSHGEFVVNAASTRKHGALLHAINEGRVPHFADGGVVGSDIAYPRLPSGASLRSGGGSSAPVTFDLRGAVMTQDLLDQMNRISARHAAGVLLTAPSLTRRDIADQQRQRIPS